MKYEDIYSLFLSSFDVVYSENYKKKLKKCTTKEFNSIVSIWYISS